MTVIHRTTTRFGAALGCIFAIVAPMHSAEGQSQPLSLSKLLATASRDGKFVLPTGGELDKVERLFQRTLLAKAGDLESLQPDWDGIDMRLEPIVTYDNVRGDVWLIREKEGHRRGRGMYAVRPAAQNPIALESPHSFFDRHTRTIGLRMFANHDIAAATWNTVRRGTVDVAHTRLHYLDAFTRAFAAVHPYGVVAQLHGFSTQWRKSEKGLEADCIVSNGSRQPDDWLRKFVADLQLAFPARNVHLYPDEIRELGATTNQQGSTLRTLGHKGFLHLELGYEFRETLLEDAHIREEYLQVLLENCRQ